MACGIVKERRSSKGSVERRLEISRVSVVEIERVQSHGGIKAASDVITQTIDPHSGVALAASIAVERKRPKRGIP